MAPIPLFSLQHDTLLQLHQSYLMAKYLASSGSPWRPPMPHFMSAFSLPQIPSAINPHYSEKASTLHAFLISVILVKTLDKATWKHENNNQQWRGRGCLYNGTHYVSASVGWVGYSTSAPAQVHLMIFHLVPYTVLHSTCAAALLPTSRIKITCSESSYAGGFLQWGILYRFLSNCHDNGGHGKNRVLLIEWATDVFMGATWKIDSRRQVIKIFMLSFSVSL